MTANREGIHVKRTFTGVVGLLLALGFTSARAMAQSGAIGCGGGNGSPVSCNGQGLGTVTSNSNGTVFSGNTDSTITSASGLPSSVTGLQVFTPNADQFDFSFSNVSFSFSDGGTFTFSDLTEAGLLSVSGEAEFGSTPSLIGPFDLVLDATSYTFAGNSGTLNAMGSADMVLDPGNVMSMTGEVGLPGTGGTGSTTPEPGTLLLLGSGLVGLGFIRRKFARA